jgi:hypothetical protein
MFLKKKLTPMWLSTAAECCVSAYAAGIVQRKTSREFSFLI